MFQSHLLINGIGEEPMAFELSLLRKRTGEEKASDARHFPNASKVIDALAVLDTEITKYARKGVLPRETSNCLVQDAQSVLSQYASDSFIELSNCRYYVTVSIKDNAGELGTMLNKYCRTLSEYGTVRAGRKELFGDNCFDNDIAPAVYQYQLKDTVADYMIYGDEDIPNITSFSFSDLSDVYVENINSNWQPSCWKPSWGVRAKLERVIMYGKRKMHYWCQDACRHRPCAAYDRAEKEAGRTLTERGRGMA